MAYFYCLLDHHSIALLVATVMSNKRNWVGGVVRLGPITRATMVATLPTDGNDIPLIGREARR